MHFMHQMVIHNVTKLLPLTSQTKLAISVTVTLTLNLTLNLNLIVTVCLTVTLTRTVLNNNISVHTVDTHKKVPRDL